eukprot:TRINITY_DN9033_c0_g1_i1.p1 TRINITY_DN9033_c0_g1~~TRINITY_DN9033_c0_g1_i1.p1  ORF type:complete len:499 (+),score=97.39 TRINITY_DN9033_c0_g1_i1:1442-2938(+)
MATVDSRLSTEDLSLKFWNFDDSSQEYVLNTQIRMPHAQPVTALSYHPSKNMCVTSSFDGKFKIWTIKKAINEDGPATNGSVYQSIWGCRSVGFYRDLQARASDFSTDGSILAIGYEHLITLWNPMTNLLYTTLTYQPAFEHIKGLYFIPNTSFLVSYTKYHLYVWDLLSCSISWSYKIQVNHFAVDTDSRFIIQSPVAENESLVILFDANDPKPQKFWRINSNVIGLEFLPSSEGGDNDILYFNSKAEFHFLNPINGLEKSVNNGSLEELPSAFQQLYGGEAVIEIKNQTQLENDNLLTSISSENLASALKNVFSGYSHILPPPALVYDTFMDHLLQKTDAPEAMDIDQNPNLPKISTNGLPSVSGVLPNISGSKNQRKPRTKNVQTPEEMVDMELKGSKFMDDLALEPINQLVQFFTEDLIIKDTEPLSVPSENTNKKKTRRNGKQKKRKRSQSITKDTNTTKPTNGAQKRKKSVKTPRRKSQKKRTGRKRSISQV